MLLFPREDVYIRSLCVILNFVDEEKVIAPRRTQRGCLQRNF